MCKSNAESGRRGSEERGFSLVELSVVMGVVAILATLTIPAIEEFIHRNKIENHCRTLSSLIRQTRLEAIKRTRPTVLRLETRTGAGFAFLDDNDNATFDDDERLLGLTTLPGGLSYSAPDTLPVVDGFDVDGSEGWIIFNIDGSVAQSGAWRIGDLRGNFLEVRVAPAATAKIKVRKWDASRAVNVDGTHWYSSDEGGRPWQWN